MKTRSTPAAALLMAAAIVGCRPAPPAANTPAADASAARPAASTPPAAATKVGDAAAKSPPPPAAIQEKPPAATGGGADQGTARPLKSPLDLLQANDLVAIRIDAAKLAQTPLYKARPEYADFAAGLLSVNPISAGCESAWAFIGGSPSKFGMPTPTWYYTFATAEALQAFQREYLPEEADVEKRATGGVDYRVFTHGEGERLAYALVGKNGVLVAPPALVEAVLRGENPGNARLAELVRQAGDAPQVVVAASLARFDAKMFDDGSEGGDVARETKEVSLAIDLVGPKTAELRLHPRGEDLRSLLLAADVLARTGQVEFESGDGARLLDGFLPFIRNRDLETVLAKVLAGVKTSIDGGIVRVEAPRPPVLDELFAAILKPPVKKPVEGFPGDVYWHWQGQFQFDDVKDAAGKPLLSWRVRMAAYDDHELSQRIDFKQPWDSEHNLPLLQQMPAHLFGSPEAREPGTTTWKLLPQRSAATFVRGGAGSAVPWTKPDFAPVAADPAQRLAPFGAEPEGGYVVALRRSASKPTRLSAAELAKAIRPPMKHAGAAAVAYTAGGVLASGGRDGMVRLWNPDEAAELAALEGHSDDVAALAAGKDGLLVSGSADGSIRIWNAKDRTLKQTLETKEGKVASLALLPGSGVAAAGEGTSPRIWKLPSGEPEPPLAEGAVRIALSSDGKLLAAGFPAPEGDAKPGRVELWNVAERTKARTLGDVPGGVRSLAFSPDGVHLVAGGGGGAILVWKTADGEAQKPFPAQKGPVDALLFEPGGRRLFARASGWRNPSLVLFDVAGRRVAESFGEEGALGDGAGGLALHPDGRSIATGGRDEVLVFKVDP